MLSAQVSRRWVDVLERADIHGAIWRRELAGDCACLPASQTAGSCSTKNSSTAKSWVERRTAEAVSAHVCPAGRRQGDASLSISPAPRAGPGRQMRGNHDTLDLIQRRATGPTKVELSLAPEIVLKETDKAWIRSTDDVRASRRERALSFHSRKPIRVRGAVRSRSRRWRSSRSRCRRSWYRVFCSRRLPAVTTRSGTAPGTGSSRTGPIFRLLSRWRPVDWRAGRRPAGRTCRLRSCEPQLPAAVSRRGRVTARCWSSSSSVKRTGCPIEMAGSAAARWRSRPADVVGSAAAVEHGPAGRPARMVR